VTRVGPVIKGSRQITTGRPTSSHDRVDLARSHHRVVVLPDRYQDPVRLPEEPLGLGVSLDVPSELG